MPRLRDVWVPAALVGVCVVLTVAATAVVAYSEEEAHRARFTERVVAARDRIDARMVTYLALLRAAAGLFSRPEPVSAREFHTFVGRLRLRAHYPGTLGLGYSARLGRGSVADATARAHALGWTDVRVWPDDPRDEIHAIVLIEPLDARNRAALGFDMRSEATRREAMDRARDSGRAVMSGVVTLVQEISGPTQPGFLVYTPVYAGGQIPSSVEERRRLLAGYAYMPLRAGDLFAGIFQDGTPIDLVLRDGESADAPLLYTGGAGVDPRADGVVVERLRIAGRVWTARFAAPPISARDHTLALAVALLGVALSALVLAVSVGREVALKRELRARTAAVASEQMRQVAETFVAILGHDLRNPLTAIILGSQSLLAHRRDDPFVQQVLSRVLHSSRRMGEMVDVILDLTRARLGGGIAVSPHPADLRAIVTDVVDELAPAHPDCSVRIDAHGDLDGVWDPERLAQVFSNLVGNALRHAEGQPVRVELSGDAPERVVASVHNVAVIPEALLPALFDPFRRGSGEDPAKGLGLGLTITRSLVLAHGGTIEVASARGRGTTFTLSLPRDARRGERAPVREPSPAPAAPLRRSRTA